MGNESEYKTFIGWIGNVGVESQNPQLNSVRVGATLVTAYRKLRHSFESMQKKKQCREG